MKKRIFTGACLSVILTLFIIFSEYDFIINILASILGAFSVYEIVKVCNKLEDEKLLVCLMMISILFPFAPIRNYILLLAISLILYLFFFILLLKNKNISKFLIIIICLLITILYKSIPEFMKLTNGKIYLIISLLIVAFTDIFALLIGKKFGNKPLVPTISPKKTIEGSIGGTICSVLIVIIISIFLEKFFGYGIVYWKELIACIIVSLGGQLGDIILSLFKRKCNCKDFSNLLPGHGGILDRFDSTLMGIPLMYLLILCKLNFIV